jgi:maltooligosyltrehalose synthase
VGLAPPGRFPIGRDVWAASTLALPPGAPRHWRNVLTGETLTATPGGSLRIAAVLSKLPVAILHGVTVPRG